MIPNLLLATGLICMLYLLHKMRSMHLLLYQAHDHARSDTAEVYRQLEALQGLYVELDLKRSLPTTRGWAASPDFLLELATHALAAHPKVVVECSSGTSTLVLARCMQINGGGMVYSLEHDASFAAQTRRQLSRHGLTQWATVIDAPLHTQQAASPWYDTRALPHDLQIDMLVIDGPPQATHPQARYPAGPVLFPRLAADGVVFLDDAARPDEQAILRRWQTEFPMLQQSRRACEKGCAVLTNAAFRQEA